MFTPGVEAEGLEFMATAAWAVQTFDAFDAENDQHGEHDFGSIEVRGQKVFWKIDLYEETVVKGSAANCSSHRGNILHALLGSADKAHRRRSSRRSNRLSWASSGGRTARTHRDTGMRQSASFPWSDGRTRGT